jgi:hypothetical protein
MGGGFDHSPGVASGTDTTALARPGNEKIVTALGTPGAGKAMRENAAFEIAAELAFDMGWAGSALAAVAGEFEPGGEVRLHGAIEHGTLGPATAIDGSASRGTGGRHGDTGQAIEAITVRANSYDLNALGRLYEVLSQADSHDMLRIIDDSGEDFLYPASLFEAVEVQEKTATRLHELLAA